MLLRRAARRLGPLVVLVLGGLALAQAWAFGPDLQVDFGRELYLPWRVSEGDRLYVDVAHWSGPLSVAWHGLLFRVFGASLVVVKASNVVVCVAIACFIYALAMRFVGVVAAVVTTGFFVGAVAFAQLLPLANYDYLTPYAHELTHGLALSLAGLVVMSCFDRRDGRVAWACGLLLAAVAATKIEVVVAYTAALAVGFALPCLGRDARARSARADLSRIVAGCAVGVLIGSVLMAWHAGAAFAFAGWTEPWRVLFDSNVASLPFYRHVMGTLDLQESLLRVFWGVMVDAAVLLAIGGSAVAWRRYGSDRGAVAVVAAVFLVACLVPLPRATLAFAVAPVLVFVALMMAASLLRGVRGLTRHEAARLAVMVFALVLAGKMALHAQLAHYGFVLIVPVTLIGVAALVGLYPKWIEARGGSRVLAIGLASVWVIALGLDLDSKTRGQREARSEAIGQAGDAMRADARAREMKQALAYLDALPADATVAVLPEGVMLNYLARRVNPTPYINFMPPELEMYGEQTIVDAFRASSPDVIVYVHKRAGLYGTPFFGRDYGRSLAGYVRDHYRTVETWGGTPFDPETRFGVRLLERDDASTAAEGVSAD